MHGHAFGCFQRAFGLQNEPHGIDLLAAARSGARLEARAAEPGAAAQLGALRDDVRGLRDEEPAFAGEEFQRLFEGFLGGGWTLRTNLIG